MINAIDNNNMLDKGIAITIILFILSMISERFITWVKLYSGKEGKKLFGFSTTEEDWTQKQSDPLKEKLREQKILGLNIVLSIFIAIISHADLFKILGNDPPYSSLGWGNYDLYTFFNSGGWNVFKGITNGLLGCILAGFFISLGSKFWHDLLDLLLYSKNLKEKLVQKEAYNIERTEDLDEILKYTQGDLVLLAIEQHSERLKKEKNVQNLLPGWVYKDHKKERCVVIHLTDSDNSKIDKSLEVTSKGKVIGSVNVSVMKNVGIATLHLSPGSKIRKNGSAMFGSICGLIKETQTNAEFYLTCGHVVTSDEFVNPGTNLPNHPDVDDDETGDTIGKVEAIYMDDQRDMALIKKDISSDFEENNLIKNPVRDLKPDDENHNTPVKVFGAISELPGYIVHCSASAKIQYGAKVIEMNNLIYVSKSYMPEFMQPISKRGDSGGLLADSTGHPIGMILGADNFHTLAMPLPFLLQSLKKNIEFIA